VFGGATTTGGKGGGCKASVDLATGGVGGDATGSDALSGLLNGLRRLKQQYICLVIRKDLWSKNAFFLYSDPLLAWVYYCGQNCYGLFLTLSREQKAIQIQQTRPLLYP